jgi:hypothetical protein
MVKIILFLPIILQKGLKKVNEFALVTHAGSANIKSIMGEGKGLIGGNMTNPSIIKR